MEYKTKNYVTWEEYKEKHPEIKDVPDAERIQKYEDQVFTLMMRLFR